jgi:hypothetical protein
MSRQSITAVEATKQRRLSSASTSRDKCRWTWRHDTTLWVTPVYLPVHSLVRLLVPARLVQHSEISNAAFNAMYKIDLVELLC